MPETIEWLLTRHNGNSAYMVESLFVVLNSEASEKHKSLAHKALTICHLEGWEIRDEETRPGSSPLALHIIHRDVMGKRTNVHFNASQNPEFDCGVLGIDTRERLLAEAREASNA